MTAKTILLTGATSGIGLALFKKLIARGDNVIACGRSADKLAVLEQQAYQTCLFDLKAPKTIKDSFDSLGDQINEIDMLILNAGDCRYIDNAKQFDGTLFANVITINLTSLGYLLEQALPKMKRGGHVVFVSSSATILPFPRSEAYGASKAGMDYLANSLRLDLAASDIDVTLVHPGFVKTPLTDKNDFSMPFLLSAEQAASRIINGVDKRKPYLHFPKRLTWVLKLLSILPSSLWQALILRKATS